MKKSIIASMFAGIIISTAGMAEAACDIWFDRGADIDRFQKVVVYPISAKSRNNFLWKNEGLVGTYNYELYKRLNRHVKGITFYELAEMIGEKEKVINVDKNQRDRLLADFPDEQSRANAVYDEFAADGYLLTYLRDLSTTEDYSPEKTVSVTKRSYTVDSGGPNGYKEYDKKSWEVWHTIPAKTLTRFILGMESTMYDEVGKKIFTYYNHQEGYDGFTGMYTSQKDDMVDELKDIKKNKHKLEKHKKTVKKLKFGNIDMPNNLGSDEYLLKSLWFAYKEEAYKMKKVEIVPEDSLLADYIVKMSVNSNEYIPYWNDPYATCDTKITWTKTYKWTDKDGNEHEGTITHYEPDVIRNVYGHYSFGQAAKVSATMYLYDAHTNKLLYSKNYRESNDKFADAYRDIFKDFYKDVNKLAEGKLKK